MVRRWTSGLWTGSQPQSTGGLGEAIPVLLAGRCGQFAATGYYFEGEAPAHYSARIASSIAGRDAEAIPEEALLALADPDDPMGMEYRAG